MLKVVLVFILAACFTGCTTWTICKEVQVIEDNPDVGGLCKKSIFGH